MKIRKAVIPAAGLGIRFLPATKTIPKEMLPIVDKPTILYSIEEIIEADIPEVVLIAGRDKTSVEDYFDTSFELEDVLERAGKRDLLKSIQSIRKRIKVITIRQQEALGLGHAILCVEPVIGKEPFAVLLSDEIMISKPGKPSAIAQVMAQFENTRSAAVSVIEVLASEVNKYGMIDAEVKSPGLWNVRGAVEKPEIGKSPSLLALTGRYVFDSEIFSCLRETKPDAFGEYQLTDAMTLLAKRREIVATTVDAHRYDTREKLGFLQAKVELALRHPEVGPAFREYLIERFGANL
ncbi:MAG: UTP--glucose-1-phosphate uridylyltransferase [Bdellovibrionales bacterium]